MLVSSQHTTKMRPLILSTYGIYQTIEFFLFCRVIVHSLAKVTMNWGWKIHASQRISLSWGSVVIKIEYHIISLFLQGDKSCGSWAHTNYHRERVHWCDLKGIEFYWLMRIKKILVAIIESDDCRWSAIHLEISTLPFHE